MEPQAQPAPQTKNLLVLIMSILLIVTVAITGLFYFQIQKLSKELAKYQTQTTPAPTTDSSRVESTDWKTYRDLQNNFEVKYPPELASNESEGKLFLYINGVTPTESETFVPNITIGNQYKKPPEFTDILSWVKLNKQIFPNLQKDSEVEIENNKFLTFEAGSGPTAYTIHYLISDTKNVYDFSVRIVGSNEEAGNQLSQYLPQILSTFKFLGSTSQNDKNLTKEECAQQGGLWRKWGLLGQEYCQIPVSDGGKSCTDGSQCSLGYCIATNDIVPGKCQTYKEIFGCIKHINNGVVDQIALCAD